VAPSNWRNAGLRLYAAPYLFSPAGAVGDASVPRAAQGSFEGETGFATFEALFARFDEGERGRIRVILGAHAADSCAAPDLLKTVDQIACERRLLTTIHLAQSQGEVDRVRAERGLDPVGYMESVGLLREGVIFAHGVHLTDDELARVRTPELRSRTARACSCAAASRRTSRASPRTAFGSGSAPMRSAWTCSRSCGRAASPRSRRPAPATQEPRPVSSTPPRLPGRTALRRPDLDRIERGATADIVIVEANKPQLQPINDPIRTLVWYASSADVDTVIVDGRPIVRGGRLGGMDEGRSSGGELRRRCGSGGGAAARPLPHRGGAGKGIT
jgi:5-methylthioadenosine/S-adenosylhomocysteine deaminase